uniref:Unspecified product n=1 Tax=Macrostomum lignano TaxID=282301 RepID=A0A1I8FAS9_9PLAT
MMTMQPPNLMPPPGQQSSAAPASPSSTINDREPAEDNCRSQHQRRGQAAVSARPSASLCAAPTFGNFSRRRRIFSGVQFNLASGDRRFNSVAAGSKARSARPRSGGVLPRQATDGPPGRSEGAIWRSSTSLCTRCRLARRLPRRLPESRTIGLCTAHCRMRGGLPGVPGAPVGCSGDRPVPRQLAPLSAGLRVAGKQSVDDQAVWNVD